MTLRKAWDNCAQKEKICNSEIDLTILISLHNFVILAIYNVSKLYILEFDAEIMKLLFPPKEKVEDKDEDKHESIGKDEDEEGNKISSVSKSGISL